MKQPVGFGAVPEIQFSSPVMKPGSLVAELAAEFLAKYKRFTSKMHPQDDCSYSGLIYLAFQNEVYSHIPF
jgi:hypothetical protein